MKNFGKLSENFVEILMKIPEKNWGKFKKKTEKPKISSIGK